MGDSYSVKAVLSAMDKGFSSTLKNAIGMVGSLGSKVNGFSFGLLSGAGQAAFNAITNSARDLISEIDSSNAAWKSFEGNMAIIASSGQTLSYSINDVKSDLQKFAQQTVYSSSDMASTFAQLAAVGTENTLELVKGFGGLAAAAENPTQAMKTLSQQATQMAAKPKVQWQDFKLMLEQTPAGIAAVAKQMGMSTQEMVTAVQDGKVATKDFFKAIEEVGNSESFKKLATQYKTAGQAMDGLKETVSNKLTPAFDVLSSVAIGSISGIADKIDAVDAEGLAKRVQSTVRKVRSYWNVLRGTFAGVGTEVGEALSALGEAVGITNLKFSHTEGIQNFCDLCRGAADAIKTAANFIETHAETIGKAAPVVLGLVGAFVALKAIGSIPGVGAVAGAIGKLASSGIGKLGQKLFKVAAGQDAVGNASLSAASQIKTSAMAFLMIGAGILLVAGAFALLAQSAIALSNAGGPAIAIMAGLAIAVGALMIGMMAMMNTVKASPKKITSMATAMLALGAAVLMVGVAFAIMAAAAINLSTAGGAAIGVFTGMIAAVALLAIGAAKLGPSLTAGAVGMLAFGAAVIMVGIGAVIAAAALQMVVGVLPSVSAYGMQGAVAIAALGSGMVVFATGAGLAGAACIVLGAGLVVFAAGAAVAGAGCIVLGAGLLVVAAGVQAAADGVVTLGEGMVLIGTGATMAGVGLGLMAAALPAVADNGVAAGIGLAAVAAAVKNMSSEASEAGAGMMEIAASVGSVQSGLSSIGGIASSAMAALSAAFKSAASTATSSGQKTGQGYTNGLQAGLKQAPTAASATVKQVTVTLRSAVGEARAIGAYIGQGLAAGMLSELGRVRAAAAQLALAAERAIRLAAQVHSPSRVAMKLGQYYGKGYGLGILDMVEYAWNAAEKLVSVPNITTPRLAMAYAGEMSEDYSYFQHHEYVIEVPLIVDGREVAKATASYTQEELDKRQTRDSRKRGKR